jgi:flagellar biosynthetic protein FliR
MELMIEKLIGFIMVLTRISAFFLIIPVFGWRSIPIRIKVGLVFLISIFFSLITPVAIESKEVSIIEAILLITNEATYGLAMGLIVILIFSSIKLCGRIIEREMGLAMGGILDPLTGETSQPVGTLLEMIFIILFFSANGHHLFLLTISRSYEAFPAGSIPSIPILAGGVIKAGSAMFIAGLKLVAPLMAAFLILMVVLAVLARIVPEMNILFISFPIRVGLGLLMMVVFLPFINSFVAEFADLMCKLLPY